MPHQMKKIQEDSVESSKMFIGKNNVPDYILLYSYFVFYPMILFPKLET